MGATVLLSFMKRFCTIKSSFLTQQQWYRLITSDLELASAISMIVLSPVMRRTASWVSSCFGGLFSLSTPEVRSVCPEPGIVRQLTFVSKYLFFVDFVGSHILMEPSRGKRGIRYTLFWPQQQEVIRPKTRLKHGNFSQEAWCGKRNNQASMYLT